MYEATEEDVLRFFSYLQKHKNFNYGTFNSFRSALSLILKFDVGSRPNIRRFLKGIFRAKPPKRKYNVVWDTNLVFNLLDTKINEDLSLLDLSKKTATLVALICAHRLQTLTRLRVENIIVSQEGIQILVTDHIKTTRPGKENPCLHLPFFPERPNICPATCLEAYIDKTASIRSSAQEFLFLTTRTPHQTATSATIGRWIKSTLAEAGVDTKAFGPYSVKHASTSAAYRNGITLENIRRTAGWSAASKTFAKFYQLPIADDPQKFAKALLKETEH